MVTRPAHPPRSPAPRRPRPTLTPASILQAALDLVAEDGLAAFSTRRLGQRLGCEAMSIYHHYPSKHHLLDAMVDHAVGSMAWPAADLPPRDRLRQAMYAYREMAHRWPALFPLVAVHRLNTPTGVRFIETVLSLVQAVVPDAELAARHFRTLGYFLVGAALDETSGYARGPSAAEPVDGAYIARECPRLASSAPYFQSSQWDATFELGAQALLDAMTRDAGRVRRST
ncbi:TetR/AcrR family transcriptional regulator [Ideonella sp.]|uniref:TetR/AcrR family transcriptional regulator n=1 Tax=Ideonella sp. TaxID=1929293 RepID=UPI0035B46C4B